MPFIPRRWMAPASIGVVMSSAPYFHPVVIPCWIFCGIVAITLLISDFSLLAISDYAHIPSSSAATLSLSLLCWSRSSLHSAVVLLAISFPMFPFFMLFHAVLLSFFLLGMVLSPFPLLSLTFPSVTWPEPVLAAVQWCDLFFCCIALFTRHRWQILLRFNFGGM